MLTAEQKKEVIEQYATHEGDTGSPEVQIAILTESRLGNLTDEISSSSHTHRDDLGLCVRGAVRRHE